MPYLGVFKKRGGPPKSSIFNRVFHYKPSILGYHYFWKHPFGGHVFTFKKGSCFHSGTRTRRIAVPGTPGQLQPCHRDHKSVSPCGKVGNGQKPPKTHVFYPPKITPCDKEQGKIFQITMKRLLG